MKIELDPMPALRARAAQQVNSHFDASAYGLRMQAQSRKQAIAHEVMAGRSAPLAFDQEAAMRNISSKDFARLILSKPHPVDAMEIERQRLLFAIECAKTPYDLQAITL